ncbi:glycosyl transferase [Mycena alexandri]|uniref:UDP-N-acetylglucosamine transferase subunit ALG13 n=1 Tax=Mycena alexandri TaxID=1745969 RepID=A0AAD6TI20_9AGAR|nr:glycosyl transferase [Mycena alexandri]
MLAFVTVGTFEFDLLVQTVLSDGVLLALRNHGYTCLVVQCGNSAFEFAHAVAGGQTVTLDRHDVRVELWKSKGALDAEYRRADLVIGHAGAGTILEVLRLRKPLIVVPNPTLLHNHQLELARALGPYLATSSIDNLAATVAAFDTGALREFPPFDGSRFRALVDDEMGF